LLGREWMPGLDKGSRPCLEEYRALPADRSES